MSDETVDQPTRELDPFAFFAGHASRIMPLGGPDRGPDPKYGFHTLYFEYRPGPVMLTIRFEGLEASFGELHINVNAFVPNSGAHASLVGSSRTQMTALMADGAEISHRVNAIPGVTYAIYGFFPDGTDARASAVAITAQELGELESSAVPTEAFEPSRFGSEALSSVSTLVSESIPSFATPISQPMTASQLTEQPFAAWTNMVGPAESLSQADLWRRAYVLQALDRYGMLKPGARGLAFRDNEHLAEIIAPMGCSLVIARDGAEEEDNVPRAPAVAVRAMSFLDQPDDLRGFDFLWSIGVANSLHSAEAAMRFIGTAMRALRPGGIAVHVFDMLATRERREFHEADLLPLHRKEIERLGLTLISQRNEIAQLNFGKTGDDAPLANTVTVHNHDGSMTVDIAPFALIARRG
jgi:hypothetical protein